MPSIADLERLLARAPADPDLLYGLAMEHAKAGRTDTACDYFDRCLSADPAYCYAYFHKARTQEAAGHPGDAASTLRQGLEAARRTGDRHAIAELSAYLDQIS